MPAIKYTLKAVVNQNVRVRLYLGDEAFRVDWCVFPVQRQFDRALGDLARLVGKRREVVICSLSGRALSLEAG